jgi:hypothetical protein
MLRDSQTPWGIQRQFDGVNTRLVALESAPGGGGIEQLTASWTDPINKTYWLIARITANATIKRISAQTASGTCSVQLTTNTGTLGSAVSCSSTLTTSVVALAITAGNYLKIAVSSVSAAVDLCVTIDYE